MKTTKKLADLPPYLFAQIDRSVADLRQSGKEILALSKSDPDHPTPGEIVEALQSQAAEPRNHHYPDFDGLPELRKAAASWYQRNYNVRLDPESQILPLLGSKEGIVHICQAYLDPGDLALVPDPAFPSYKTGAILAGGKVYPLPLRPENKYLPDLGQIPQDIARQAKLMFLNYPNNPTGAICTPDFFAQVVEFARTNDVMVCHDFAYSQTTFNGYKAPSFLQTAGALDVGIEFFTFSKAFNMAGWRLGLAVGNSEIIKGLKIVETHVNAGIFTPIQYAGARGLKIESGFFTEMNQNYFRRLNKVADFFNSRGWNLTPPQATVYAWVPCPQGYSAVEFTKFLLDKAGVAVSPGTGFGDLGEGYVRICITYPDEQVEKALIKIGLCLDEYNLCPGSEA